MNTIEQTRPRQPVVSDGFWKDAGPEQAWSEMPSDGTAGPTSRSEAAFGATRIVLLSLAALVILAPFAPGLVLVALAAAILGLPYLLFRRLFGRFDD